MKAHIRLLTTAILLITFFLAIFNRLLADLWHQYDVTSYISSTVRHPFHHEVVHYMPPLPGTTGDKAIVLAKTSKEDTDWVTSELADWRNAIYTVDAPPSSHLADPAILTTPANKGHEAMAYLTYLIDNYRSLPSVMAFVHPHRSGFFSAWHTDSPAHSNVDALRSLNLSFVEQSGYVNLRCNWSPGCRPEDRENAHVTPERWDEVFEGTSTPGQSVPHPGAVGQACCAQFAVSREAVQRRPVEDYVRMREWLLVTELNDRTSGRVMEFLWHVIFGKEGVFCPAEKMCYCQVYGRC